ncbi:class I SAM-dependent methyltransferase [bacterium]|nr:class I SAM-dependent methyltransferase [bacterium]
MVLNNPYCPYKNMESKKFDPKQIRKLTDPARYEFQSPDLIWDTLNPVKPEVLIDIGAGTGFFALPFADKAIDCRIYACDTSEFMIQWMTENIPERYINRIIPLLSTENSIKLESGSADLVYMINLHHELNNPLEMLKECLRLLKNGGQLLVIDWKDSITPMGPPLSIRISAQEIQRQVMEVGFKNVRQHSVLSYHSFIVGEKVLKK